MKHKEGKDRKYGEKYARGIWWKSVTNDWFDSQKKRWKNDIVSLSKKDNDIESSKIA